MNPTHNMNRDALAGIQSDLDALRPDDADFLIIGVGARGPNVDCHNGNAIATVAMGADEATSEAAHLADAIALARAKILRERERREKEREARKQSSNGEGV